MQYLETLQSSLQSVLQFPLQKNGNGVAAIAAALSHYVIVTVATSFNSDINLGVVSGIIAGLLAAALYNRFL